MLEYALLDLYKDMNKSQSKITEELKKIPGSWKLAADKELKALATILYREEHPTLSFTDCKKAVETYCQ